MTRLPLSLLVLLYACHEEPAPVRTPESSGLRQLALQKLDGDGAVDLRLRALQSTVTKSPDKFDAWIMLGRAWIQKARQANDPSLYRNADACAGAALELKPEHPLALDLRGMVL